jgi:hypothetical protein
MRAIADAKNSIKALNMRSKNDGELASVFAVVEASFSAVDEAITSINVVLAVSDDNSACTVRSWDIISEVVAETPSTRFVS